MKKMVLLLMGVLSLSCNDLENKNVMPQETVTAIENGVKNSNLYTEVQNKISDTELVYEGQTLPGNEVFSTYFADHKVIKVNFEESAFSTILNRRIRNADSETERIGMEELYEKCFDNYENAAYSVSLGVYSQLSGVYYEYKQAVLLNSHFDVIDVICYTSSIDNTLFKDEFPCK